MGAQTTVIDGGCGYVRNRGSASVISGLRVAGVTLSCAARHGAFRGML
jgi:hypothetical protein